MNLERVNATKNIDLLRQYLQSRREAKIALILTLMDRHDENYFEFMVEPEEIISQTKDFRDILIYDPMNELYSQKDIEKATSLCNKLRDEGLISTAGAYGEGRENWSMLFDPINSSNKIIGIHQYHNDRNEAKKTVEPYENSGKPMTWDESFRITADEWIKRCRWFKDEGVSCFNYYGTRSRVLFPDLENEDPDSWRKYNEEGSKLCQELNK